LEKLNSKIPYCNNVIPQLCKLEFYKSWNRYKRYNMVHFYKRIHFRWRQPTTLEIPALSSIDLTVKEQLI